MTIRPGRALLAAVAVALAAVPAAAAAELRVTELEGARFPERAFVLTLPSDTLLHEGRVRVRENGRLVSEVSVVPAEAAEEGEFGVVLALDASNSMKGEPITEAVAAAKAFAAQRTETQKVAIVTFNSEPQVLLPFTTEQETIDAALASEPPLAAGTKLYDGVDTALTLLERAEIAAGSLIVLSDGADLGSVVSAEQVVGRAREAHVRIFSVGLRSDQFRAGPLEQMAEASGGDYTEAARSTDLERIFDQLGAQLANEYLLSYRSRVRPETDVKVAIEVEGIEGLAVSDYVSPALAADPGAPFHRTFAERFWKSAGGMVAVTALAAGLLALGIGTVLRPRRRTLRKRMAEFVSLAAPSEKAGGERELMLARAEKTFERTRWWTRFKEDLELADVRTPPVHILIWTAIGTLLAVWVLATVGGSLLFAPLGLGVPLIIRAIIYRKLNRKRQLFADQLPDNLQVLSSALRAGHSLVGALSVVVDDCPEPSKTEFGRIIADEQLGVPLEDAFGVVSRRMTNRDLEQVGLVAALQRETGGNTAEVLDRVAETIRGRFELRRLVKTLTTQGRMSRWVVSLLPVGLLALITLINPEYMKPLYVNPIGRLLLVVAGVMIVAGSLAIKRIINIKV